MAGTFTQDMRKRIVVACDGTWKDRDGNDSIPSNVTVICRCIQQETRDPKSGHIIPQIIYYQSGVGTETTTYNKVAGGTTGEGLSENIREAYSFICNNYDHGDEIFLIGFSRGAFTARSIASLIGSIGLLTRKGLRFFYQIFQDWRHQSNRRWRSPHPNEPWPKRPPGGSPEYCRKLVQLELTRLDIPVKAIALWDAVGALGIPMVAFLPQGESSEYSFIDTKMDPHIENAFQALALDEKRRTFRPTIWEKPEGQKWPLRMKQCWFPGVHSDVGGGYEEADLANLALTWMMSQLEPLLDFDRSYLIDHHQLTREQHKQRGRPVREWGLGKIHDSMSFIFVLLGSARRTPHEYCAVDRMTYKSKQRLRNTHEFVHPSVRIRMGLSGYGYDDKGTYDAYGLDGWTMEGTVPSPESSTSDVGASGRPAAMSDVKWVRRDPSGKKGDADTMIMLEDTLGELERLIMRSWPTVEKQFNTIRPGDHASKIHMGRKEALRALHRSKAPSGKDGQGKRGRQPAREERSDPEPPQHQDPERSKEKIDGHSGEQKGAGREKGKNRRCYQSLSCRRGNT